MFKAQDLRKLVNFKEISKMAGFNGECPDDHSKGKI